MSAKKIVEKVAKRLSSGKKKHDINIREADDGSYIVRHRKDSSDSGPYDPGVETTHKDGKAVAKHIGGILGMSQAHSGKPIGKIKDMGGDKDDEQ